MLDFFIGYLNAGGFRCSYSTGLWVIFNDEDCFIDTVRYTLNNEAEQFDILIKPNMNVEISNNSNHSLENMSHIYQVIQGAQQATKFEGSLTC